MKPVFRHRQKIAASDQCQPSTDGLNARIWQVVHVILATVKHRDEAGFVLTSERLAQSLSSRDQKELGGYLYYLLKYQILSVLGRKPTTGDLQLLASRIGAEYMRFLHVETSLLESTLRTAFQLEVPDQKVEGGEFTVSASVALGLLLDDPDTELEVIRPHLSSWWRNNVDSFWAAANGTA